MSETTCCHQSERSAEFAGRPQNPVLNHRVSEIDSEGYADQARSAVRIVHGRAPQDTKCRTRLSVYADPLATFADVDALPVDAILVTDDQEDSRQ